MMQFLRKEKGFTLIEIMIVVIILGILVGLAIPQIGTIRKTTWQNVCKSNRGTLESLAEAYNTTNNTYGGNNVGDLQTTLLGASLLKAKIYCPASGTTDTYSINASGAVNCSNIGTGPSQHAQ